MRRRQEDGVYPYQASSSRFSTLHLAFQAIQLGLYGSGERCFGAFEVKEHDINSLLLRYAKIIII